MHRRFYFPSHNNNNYYPQCIHVVTMLWITLGHLHALIIIMYSSFVPSVTLPSSIAAFKRALKLKGACIIVVLA